MNGLPQMIDAQHLPSFSSREYLPTEDGFTTFRKRCSLGLGQCK
jgi:hypothetical protein